MVSTTGLTRIVAGALMLAYPLVASAAHAEDNAERTRLITRLVPSVVGITTKSMVDMKTTGEMAKASAKEMKSQQGYGTGFIIDTDGYIMTNRHVIENAYEIMVTTSDGSNMRATLVGHGNNVDLALLKVNSPKPLKPIKFGDSDNVQVGERVLVIGNPFGFGTSVTSGIVSAVNKNLKYSPFDSFIQTDAAINRGNSGGPLFNLKGEVIGVNTAYYGGGVQGAGSIGIGFSIASEIAKESAYLLKTYGYPRVGWIGVDAQTVTAEIANALQLKSPTGAIVASVDDKGPAAGKLQSGDIITKVGRHQVRDDRDFYRETAIVLGTDTNYEIWRDGRTMSFRMMPQEWPGEAKLRIDPMRPSQKMATWSMDLGLDVSEINEESRREYNLGPQQHGVVVTDVKPDSPAASSGFATGDVILTVQTKAVNSPLDVKNTLDQVYKSKQDFVTNLVKSPKGLKWMTLPIKVEAQ